MNAIFSFWREGKEVRSSEKYRLSGFLTELREVLFWMCSWFFLPSLYFFQSFSMRPFISRLHWHHTSIPSKFLSHFVERLLNFLKAVVSRRKKIKRKSGILLPQPEGLSAPFTSRLDPHPKAHPLKAHTPRSVCRTDNQKGLRQKYTAFKERTSIESKHFSKLNIH